MRESIENLDAKSISDNTRLACVACCEIDLETCEDGIPWVEDGFYCSTEHALSDYLVQKDKTEDDFYNDITVIPRKLLTKMLDCKCFAFQKDDNNQVGVSRQNSQ